MSTIEYDPDFQPPQYADGRDRVKAGGPRGFNEVFDAIREELDQVSDVVKAIKDELDRLGEKPPPVEIRTTLTPALVPIGSTPWAHFTGGATKPAGATAATGMMPVTLPQGSRIRSLRATGRNSGNGALDIILRRQPFAGNAPSAVIVAVGGTGNPFDAATNAPTTEISKVDNDQFRYYLTVELDTAAAGDTVQVMTIQIAHIAEA